MGALIFCAIQGFSSAEPRWVTHSVFHLDKQPRDFHDWLVEAQSPAFANHPTYDKKDWPFEADEADWRRVTYTLPPIEVINQDNPRPWIMLKLCWDDLLGWVRAANNIAELLTDKREDQRPIRLLWWQL